MLIIKFQSQLFFYLKTYQSLCESVIINIHLLDIKVHTDIGINFLIILFLE